MRAAFRSLEVEYLAVGDAVVGAAAVARLRRPQRGAIAADRRVGQVEDFLRVRRRGRDCGATSSSARQPSASSSRPDRSLALRDASARRKASSIARSQVPQSRRTLSVIEPHEPDQQVAAVLGRRFGVGVVGLVRGIHRQRHQLLRRLHVGNGLTAVGMYEAVPAREHVLETPGAAVRGLEGRVLPHQLARQRTDEVALDRGHVLAAKTSGAIAGSR